MVASSQVRLQACSQNPWEYLESRSLSRFPRTFPIVVQVSIFWVRVSRSSQKSGLSFVLQRLELQKFGFKELESGKAFVREALSSDSCQGKCFYRWRSRCMVDPRRNVCFQMEASQINLGCGDVWRCLDIHGFPWLLRTVMKVDRMPTATESVLKVREFSLSFMSCGFQDHASKHPFCNRSFSETITSLSIAGFIVLFI